MLLVLICFLFVVVVYVFCFVLLLFFFCLIFVLFCFFLTHLPHGAILQDDVTRWRVDDSHRRHDFSSVSMA